MSILFDSFERDTLMIDATDSLIVCYCAEWCSTCREFRPAFEALQAMEPGLRTLWIDIEDEAERVADVDIEMFPTLLIVTDGTVRFFGAVPPHAAFVRDLLARARRGALPPLSGESVVRLLGEISKS